VKPGRYIIPVAPVDDMCPQEKLPTGETLDVSYDSNQNMFINFGGGSYTLYWDGVDYYEYQQGNRFQLSVITYEGGASFAWSNDGCFISSNLVEEGAPTPTPVPVEPTSEAWTDTTEIAGDSFSTTYDAPDYLCPEENLGLLPDLTGAVLTAQADGTFLFSLDGDDYTLENVDGIHGYALMDDAGNMLSIGMNGFYEGVGTGTYAVTKSDGSYCISMLTFTPE
jgi:hypothetical protein